MKKLMKNETGFTLIELLIVVIIVAVLVAVGVPLLQGNIERAKLTEADAGLGILRTGLRARLAEHGSYILPVAPDTIDDLGAKLRVAGAGGAAGTPGDLDGRFFSEESYTLATAELNPTTFCIDCDGALSQVAFAVRANEVDGTGNAPTLQRSMDHDGTIYRGLNCQLGSEVN